MKTLDIRIGTVVNVNDRTLSTIREILDHGFESFNLCMGNRLPEMGVEKFAKELREVISDRAVISALSLFGNALEDEMAVRDWERCIDMASLFHCELVSGFPGALKGRPVPDSLPRFKAVWSELARRAEGKGIKIAFENCAMEGYWEASGRNMAHAPSAWEMMFHEVPSDALGLEWEPCHQMISLIDPLPQLRKWLPKIYHVHGKDATIAWDIISTYGIRGGKEYAWHRTPGFGDTNWTDVISILRMGKFRGSIDIEGFHDPVYVEELEMTGQVHALNYLKNCRGGKFIPNP
ncbi:MAG: sugar phosphate isomerase/epimerase [Armatimonadetes bacterium]|nr:sugar phosphate isomerase/epimerase [Armatimonadota bacterium]